mgnify:CR=1 FL=1
MDEWVIVGEVSKSNPRSVPTQLQPTGTMAHNPYGQGRPYGYPAPQQPYGQAYGAPAYTGVGGYPPQQNMMTQSMGGMPPPQHMAYAPPNSLHQSMGGPVQHSQSAGSLAPGMEQMRLSGSSGPPAGKKYHIFISYRVATDSLLAERICDKLQQLDVPGHNGLRVRVSAQRK